VTTPLDTGTYASPGSIPSWCLIGMIVVFLIASYLLGRSIAADLDKADRAAKESQGPDQPFDGANQFD
jgi:hypothetical protein